MSSSEVVNSLLNLKPGSNNSPVFLRIDGDFKIKVYPESVCSLNGDFFFIGKKEDKKYLWILSSDEKSLSDDVFAGSIVYSLTIHLKQCLMNHTNADILREKFDFTRPVLIGLQNSIGLGDRLGIAGPGHLRGIDGSGIKPILAQQSIRELQRTQRTPEEVMDAATWAVFQEGYRDGFGSDADHLKTTEDIALMHRAGFTMYTIDPGDYVDNAADSDSVEKLNDKLAYLPWDELEDSKIEALSRYSGKRVSISKHFFLCPTEEDVARALVKYGSAIAHTTKMYRYLVEIIGEGACELEISVDETESVTTPFEHYFMVNEFNRMGVQFVSLAPRFVGAFEKGIDYKGDIQIFREEYKKHLAIAQKMGPYKISLHSGSDKFSVYDVIGSLKDEGTVHIKTAGTSYLEALRTVAKNEPDHFRAILDFSRSAYKAEKATYHVSANLSGVPAGVDCDNEELLKIFTQDNARQVLHVAFGKVLTAKNNQGEYLFKDKILDCLAKNENDHYGSLARHIKKHVAPIM